MPTIFQNTSWIHFYIFSINGTILKKHKIGLQYSNFQFDWNEKFLEN